MILGIILDCRVCRKEFFLILQSWELILMRFSFSFSFFFFLFCLFFSFFFLFFSFLFFSFIFLFSQTLFPFSPSPLSFSPPLPPPQMVTSIPSHPLDPYQNSLFFHRPSLPYLSPLNDFFYGEGGGWEGGKSLTENE